MIYYHTDHDDHDDHNKTAAITNNNNYQLPIGKIS